MASRYQVKNKQAYTPVSGRNWKERGLKNTYLSYYWV